MGSSCSGGPKVKGNYASYNIQSTCFDHHYTAGDTVGKGAFGVVKICQLKPLALQALKVEITPPPDSHDDGIAARERQNGILRRQTFKNTPLAVKIMRHAMDKTEGDSVDKLEVQMQELQQSIDAMEQQVDNADMLTVNDELQWHHDYMEILTKKLNEKRSNRTKKTPRENMIREVSLVQKCCQGHFIMQHVETFEEPGTFCVVFERCYGSVASRYPDGVCDCQAVCKNGYQLLSAVAYLHSVLILHRDIKPENLMYRTEKDDSEVVLGDFGMAVELRKADDRCQGCAGTPHFVAPESFHSYYQSFQSDCWAVGCTLYLMLLGQCPFEVHCDNAKKSGKSIASTGLYAMLRSTRMGVVLQGWKPQFEQEHTAALARKIVHPKHMPEWIDLAHRPIKDTPSHGSAKQLISSLLQKDPKCRCSADEALKHPWFSDEVASKQLREPLLKTNQSKAIGEPEREPLAIFDKKSSGGSFERRNSNGKVHPVMDGIDQSAVNLD